MKSSLKEIESIYLFWNYATIRKVAGSIPNVGFPRPLYMQFFVVTVYSSTPKAKAAIPSEKLVMIYQTVRFYISG
jgi:hypothetical protein